MGQAKQRGGFEQRKSSAIARDLADAQKDRDKRVAAEAARTPEEKARGNKIRSQLMISVMAGICFLN